MARAGGRGRRLAASRDQSLGQDTRDTQDTQDGALKALRACDWRVHGQRFAPSICPVLGVLGVPGVLVRPLANEISCGRSANSQRHSLRAVRQLPAALRTLPSCNRMRQF